MTTAKQLATKTQEEASVDIFSRIDDDGNVTVGSEELSVTPIRTFSKPWSNAIKSVHTERADEVLNNPSSIHSVIEEYSGGGEAYSKLVGALNKSDFDDFMRLQNLFIKAQYDEQRRVKRWIETGLARSIKNAIIDSSASFPITTLDDVKNRLDAYSETGIKTPSIHETIETTIEALYDEDWDNALRVVDGLLSSVPQKPHKPNSDIGVVVDLLARIRTVLVLQQADTDDELHFTAVYDAIKTVVNVTDKPVIPKRKIEGDLDEMEIEEIMQEAESRSYEDATKRQLYEYVFHTDPYQVDAFTAYLYLSGRDIVEDQRHGVEKPTRARLAVAEQQFKTVRLLGDNGFASLTDKELAWAHSHEHVSRGAMHASGWIESQRENQPEPEFEKAATEYMHASMILAEHIPVRSMKYRSKAMRYSAKKAPRDSAIMIHQKAVESLITQADEVKQTYFTGAVQDRIRYHTFQKHKHALDKAYIEGDYKKVNTHYYECIGMADSIDLPLRTHGIEKKHLTAQAKRSEADCDYETAIAAYEQIDRGKAFVPNRKVLIEMKQALRNESYNEMVELLTELKGTHKLIHLAVHVIHGEYPENGFPLMENITASPIESGHEQSSKQKIVEHTIKQTMNTDNFAGMRDEDLAELFNACKHALSAPVEERWMFRELTKDVFMRV